MLPLLRSLLPLFNVAALVLVAKRRRMLRTFRAAGADTDSRAIAMDSNGLAGWWLRRLAGGGVLKRTTGGLYWLDKQEYSRYRRVRFVRVGVVLAIGVIAMLLVNR
jgi:hypothetical protein